eukprot:1611516-Lingulodinium_polyedra.AAC.1
MPWPTHSRPPLASEWPACSHVTVNSYPHDAPCNGHLLVRQLPFTRGKAIANQRLFTSGRAMGSR